MCRLLEHALVYNLVLEPAWDDACSEKMTVISQLCLSVTKQEITLLNYAPTDQQSKPFSTLMVQVHGQEDTVVFTVTTLSVCTDHVETVCIN